MFGGRRRRREEELAARDRWRVARRLMDEDVTVLGEPGFFDPRHGPSMHDVEWTPPGGTARTIAVCAADARRLGAGEEPLVRMVRVGDRWVPWHQSAGIAGAVDAGVQLAMGSSHGVHGQQNLAAAYLKQTTDGANGVNGPYG